eukprot:7381643-Prymnesium_polylepis.1
MPDPHAVTQRPPSKKGALPEQRVHEEVAVELAQCRQSLSRHSCCEHMHSPPPQLGGVIQPVSQTQPPVSGAQSP